jgi:LysR family transcriptional regulator for bpeEF and oprC
MHGLQQFVAFAETAKHGSFAAAARELGSAPSTIAKAVGRLETGLGVRMFHRTTRQVSLTPDGERLFARCQRVLAEIDELQSDAAGTRAAPSGTLRIDMPIVYGRRVLLPLLARLLREHAELQVDARLSDAFVDLVKEGVDVAIRVGRLDDSSLAATRIGQQEMVLVAAPTYLRRRGTPTDVASLAGHDAILFRLPTSRRERAWQFRARGRLLDVHPAARLRCNDGETMVAAARLGLGLAQLPEYMVADEIAARRLVELLPAQRPPSMPIHAVMPANRMVPPRVRALLDALQTALQRA